MEGGDFADYSDDLVAELVEVMSIDAGGYFIGHGYGIVLNIGG